MTVWAGQLRMLARAKAKAEAAEAAARAKAVSSAVVDIDGVNSVAVPAVGPSGSVWLASWLAVWEQS